MPDIARCPAGSPPAMDARIAGAAHGVRHGSAPPRAHGHRWQTVRRSAPRSGLPPRPRDSVARPRRSLSWRAPNRPHAPRVLRRHDRRPRSHRFAGCPRTGPETASAPRVHAPCGSRRPLRRSDCRTAIGRPDDSCRGRRASAHPTESHRPGCNSPRVTRGASLQRWV